MSVTLSDDQFKQLLAAMGSSKRGSFAQCSHFYEGQRDPEILEAFLSAIEVYKNIERISEEDAITGLSLLLKGEASLWWQGVKNGVSRWSEFCRQIRNCFAPKKPAYLVYQEIMAEKQAMEQMTERFVAKKRMLFPQLPKPEHTETQQIDMIYSMLRLDLRRAIPRDSVDSFDKLLELARGVERNNEERNMCQLLQTPSQRPNKLRCSFCRNPGHTMDVCRKRKKEEGNSRDSTSALKPKFSEAVTQVPSPSQPRFSCYGCGAPGVVRSNCPTCSGKLKAPKTEAISFCAMDIQVDTRARPVVFISIDGINGKAHIDSCAKTSVASYGLYCQLKEKGYSFENKKVCITMADGVPKWQNVLTVKTLVTLGKYTIPTTFVVLPESRDNKTLLGIGFIQDAKMVLDLPQFTWHSLLDPDITNELYQEDFAFFPDEYITPQDALKTMALPSPVTPLSVTPETSPAAAAVCIEVPAQLPQEAGTSNLSAVPGVSTTPSQEPALPEESASIPYILKRIDLPPTPEKPNPRLFDGYSPRYDYMLRDAQENAHQNVKLSPHSRALFMSSLDDDMDV